LLRAQSSQNDDDTRVLRSSADSSPAIQYDPRLQIALDDRRDKELGAADD